MNEPTPVPEAPLDLTRIWRAYVEPTLSLFPARAVFVESSSGRGARTRIASAIASLEGLEPTDVEYRIHGLRHARTLLDEGASEDEDLRIFEARNAAGVTTYVMHPLFLMEAPGPFCLRWGDAWSGRQVAGIFDTAGHRREARKKAMEAAQREKEQVMARFAEYCRKGSRNSAPFIDGMRFAVITRYGDDWQPSATHLPGTVEADAFWFGVLRGHEFIERVTT